MRLVINQSNIEEAITNWVFDQLVESEGKVVTIELAATRGSGGFTGTVNVYNEGEVPEQPEPKKKSSSTTASKEPLGIKKRAGRPRKIVEAAPVHTEKAADDEELVKTEVQETLPLEVTQEQEEVKTENADPAESDPTPVSDTPRASLFGDLKKPVNN